ncbi:hypothetical protein GQ53DRAFT_890616 [Thozetella sp. PMI_491]|nr:hypothetical protein GQ53DRAFT_890616 [Thozetella sp. PMI_491]
MGQSLRCWASFSLFACALADTVTLDWALGWKTISPDGTARPVVAVNDLWPPPAISLHEGDRLVIHVTNNLGNETASIHFHGLYQRGQNAMDGPVAATQCPIPPGSKFTYDFKACSVIGQVGTYWWHAHVAGEIADGLRGPLIINDRKNPYQDQITGGEITITLGDWYHDQAPDLIRYYQSKANADDGGPEPIPDSGLINDGQDVHFGVEPGKTYYVHVINTGNFVGAYLDIDGHDVTIIEADGIYTEPKTVGRLYLAAAQRYGVLLTTKANNKNNYLVMCSLDTDMFDDIPPGYNPLFYGYLIYDNAKALPTKKSFPNLRVFDDMDLVTSTSNQWDQAQTYTTVDRQIILNMGFTDLDDQNRATVNNVTFVPQKVPSLYTALSTGKEALNPVVYGVNSIPFVIKNNDIVEIIINNYDNGNHPWHLHGHTFQVIHRNKPGGGYYKGQALKADSDRPLRRDTVTVYANSYIALRFKADNPGVHLMHCHIEWHVEAGLSVTLIESPDIMQQTQYIPGDHLDACIRQGIPVKGNAAGNTKNFTNLDGANISPNKNPSGAIIDPTTLGPPGKHRAYWPRHGRHNY